MKLLIGGSPCTHWSIAQTKNRETEPEGLGWELFKNYLIALEKFKPSYFLYENNKSMALAIRAQITRELGVEPILINSALVSAQNRQRLYWSNIPGVEQPEDRGILLRDILESGVCWEEKAYCLAANRGGHSLAHDIKKSKYDYVAEPVRVCNINGGGQGNRIYSSDAKSCAIKAQGRGMGWHGQGLYAIPADGYQSRLVVETAAIYQQPHGFNKGGIKYERTPTLTANGDWAHNNLLIETADGKTHPVYEVRDGQITIKGQQYPIKLADGDGFYIIRKLTVRECMRLQTVPEDYIFPVSDTQAYKMLGNGWTVDVIAHILSFCPGITEKPLEVLSMYDGMSCGHLALDKLGAHIARYYATEIDKYAIKTTQCNFPDTIQLGDAFQVRDDGWRLPGMTAEEPVKQDKPKKSTKRQAAPLKIGLIDVDGHHFPNLALMKLSAWHKAQGDTVEWWSGFSEYDRVYMSKVFDETYTPDVLEPVNTREIIRGGTGYGLDNRLPDEVEHIYPDYSLYPELTKDTAYGFLTRGCPRACPVCIVAEKEGRRSVKAADLSEWWRGQKYIKLLDPNLLACPEHMNLLGQLADSGAWVDFTQGLDARLLTAENIQAIGAVKLKEIHFAWDSMEESVAVLQGLRRYAAYAARKPHGQYATVYVLTNYDTTMEENLFRIYTLRDMGYDPYVMIYDKPNAPREIRLLQRWCNNRFIFKTVPDFYKYDPKRGWGETDQ